MLPAGASAWAKLPSLFLTLQRGPKAQGVEGLEGLGGWELHLQSQGGREQGSSLYSCVRLCLPYPSP